MKEKSKTERPLRAFAVTEDYESTGAILFAKHSVAARRRGAEEFADGDFSAVSCKRAPWADHCAETGVVPVSLMIEHGWHFECFGCGRRIDGDLPDLCYDESRYAGWKPADVIGTQHSAVYCDARCEAEHMAMEADRRRRQDRWIERFRRLILSRFPDAELTNSTEPFQRDHAYCFKLSSGRWRVDQVIVFFTFPGMRFGPASLHYNQQRSWRTGPPVKPHFTCLAGDKEAFEAWARGHRKAA